MVDQALRSLARTIRENEPPNRREDEAPRATAREAAAGVPPPSLPPPCLPPPSPERQLRIVDHIESVTGDRHSRGNWVLLVRAMSATPEGFDALTNAVGEIEEILMRRDGAPPLNPGAFLNKRLRTACSRHGIPIPPGRREANPPSAWHGATHA